MKNLDRGPVQVIDNVSKRYNLLNRVLSHTFSVKMHAGTLETVRAKWVKIARHQSTAALVGGGGGAERMGESVELKGGIWVNREVGGP